MAESSPKPEHQLKPLGPPTERSGFVTGYCQRCKAGAHRPEEALKRCPVCARDICANCRNFEPELEAHVCLECAGLRRAARKAGRRSGMHLLRLGASAVAIAVGTLMALKLSWASLVLLGVALVVAGIVTFAWQLVCHHVCPVCEGEAKARRKKGCPIEYECRVCGHVWVD